MTLEEESEEFAAFCKTQWNTRAKPEEFAEALKERFKPEHVKQFVFNFLETIGKNEIKFIQTLFDYLLIIINEDPSMVFYDLDLKNEICMNGARVIIELASPDLYTHLPVNNEKSAISALNILLIVLMDPDRNRLKQNILKLALSPYLSILIASGRLFCREKYEEAQRLYKEINPFDYPIFQLPLTQAHLPLALFPPELKDLFQCIHSIQDLFFLLALGNQFILKFDQSTVLEPNSIKAALFVHVTHLYISKPSYTLSIFLNNVINSRDPEEQTTQEKLEALLHLLYDGPNLIDQHDFIYSNTNVIQEELPNGVLPTYDIAFQFFNQQPDLDSIPFDRLIEESLKYPALIQKIVYIFISKLQEKDINSSVILATQLLKRVDDIQIAWSLQNELINVLKSLYDCLCDLTDENEFEILFLLFISLIFSQIKSGGKSIEPMLIDYFNTLKEPSNLYLRNILFDGNLLVSSDLSNLDPSKPLDRAILFLNECNQTNDIDLASLERYPYLFVSAFIWGIQTVNPNSLKLNKVKLPDYKLFKLWFIYLSVCHQRMSTTLSNTLNNICFVLKPTHIVYSMLVRYMPSDISEIRYIILNHLSQLASGELNIKYIKSLFTIWRALIKIMTIEKFVAILLEVLLMIDRNIFSDKVFHNYFNYAGIAVASACLTIPDEILQQTPIESDGNSDKCDDALRCALWSALLYIKNYEGSNLDGFGPAVFCSILLLSMKYCKDSEFLKVLDFIAKLKAESCVHSLHWSFATSLLLLAIYIPPLQKLVNIDMLDTDYLQLNWQIGIDFFFIQSECHKGEQSQLAKKKKS